MLYSWFLDHITWWRLPPIPIFSIVSTGSKINTSIILDGSLLFCRATVEDCGKMLPILEAYEGALGQKVNRSKTSLFCRATVEDCGKMLHILEAYEGASGQKVNRSKTSLFFYQIYL